MNLALLGKGLFARLAINAKGFVSSSEAKGAFQLLQTFSGTKVVFSLWVFPSMRSGARSGS